MRNLISKIKKVNWGNVFIRTTKTFFQAFITAISVDSFMMINDIATLKTIVVSVVMTGLSAGVCAVWNMILELYKNGKISELDDDIVEEIDTKKTECEDENESEDLE